MSAPKRRTARESTSSPKQSHSPVKLAGSTGPRTDLYLPEAIRHLRKADRHYAQSVHAIRQQATRARKRNHPIEAAILDCIADLMNTPVKSLEEWERNLKLAVELLSWLPRADEISGLDVKKRKAWMTRTVLKQQFDPTTEDALIQEATQQPGAPQTTRLVAIRAMELYRECKDWDVVAKNLACDWTMVDNPANSIRRQVDFLKRTLKDCGVTLEDL